MKFLIDANLPFKLVSCQIYYDNNLTACKAPVSVKRQQVFDAVGLITIRLFIFDMTLAVALNNKGYDIIHINDLQNKEFTTDKEFRNITQDKNLIVITKDSDFYDSLILNKVPKNLLWVTTANIVNKDLLNLFDKYFNEIAGLFAEYDLIELSNDEIIAHETN